MIIQENTVLAHYSKYQQEVFNLYKILRLF